MQRCILGLKLDIYQIGDILIIDETKDDIKNITDLLKSYRELLTYPKDGPLSPAELHEFMEREIYMIIEESKFFNKQVE